MASTPVLAHAANGPSGAVARNGAELTDGNEFAGSTMLVAVIVIVGLLAGLLLIDSGSDNPTSP